MRIIERMALTRLWAVSEPDNVSPGRSVGAPFADLCPLDSSSVEGGEW
jgi:hypothetical protein